MFRPFTTFLCTKQIKYNRTYFQLIFINLQQYKEDAEQLTHLRAEIPDDQHLDFLLMQIKDKINSLTVKANQGMDLIQVNLFKIKRKILEKIVICEF